MNTPSPAQILDERSKRLCGLITFHLINLFIDFRVLLTMSKVITMCQSIFEVFIKVLKRRKSENILLFKRYILLHVWCFLVILCQKS